MIQVKTKYAVVNTETNKFIYQTSGSKFHNIFESDEFLENLLLNEDEYKKAVEISSYRENPIFYVIFDFLYLCNSIDINKLKIVPISVTYSYDIDGE